LEKSEIMGSKEVRKSSIIFKQDRYSLYEMCKIDIKQLNQMIFILDHVCEDDEIVVENLIKKSQEVDKD